MYVDNGIKIIELSSDVGTNAYYRYLLHVLDNQFDS